MKSNNSYLKIKLLKNIFLFYIVLTYIQAHGQHPDFVFENGCDFRYINTDSLIKSKKIIIIGEYHNQLYNLNIQYTFLKNLNYNHFIFPKYILLEEGYAFSYILNKYLSTGNEYYLEPFTSNSHSIYKELYLYNNQLSGSNKFNYYGIDYEKNISLTFFAIHEVFKENTSPVFVASPKAMQIQEIVDYFKTIDAKKIGYLFMKKELIRFHDIYLSDSLSLKNIIKSSDYRDLKLIMLSYEKSLRFRKINYAKASENEMKERDSFMADNIYSLVKKDSECYLFGQFGSTHASLTFQKDNWTHKNYNSFTSLLNTDKKYVLSNNKVSSAIIYYDYIADKHYDFLQINNEQLSKLKKESSNYYLSVQNFYTKSKFDYIIYFNLGRVNNAFKK